jgi:hypothetical protein
MKAVSLLFTFAFVFFQVEGVVLNENEAPNSPTDKGTIGIVCTDSNGNTYSPDRDPDAYEACMREKQQQEAGSEN